MKTKLILIFTTILILSIVNIGSAVPTFKMDLIYTVEQGDVLVNLARKFGLSVEEIRSANNLDGDQFIRVGDQLIIPQHFYNTDYKQEEISFYHREDRLEDYRLDCQQEYRVKIKEKKVKKNINVRNLRTLDYYVKRGDNLYDLASEFNTTIDVLKVLNDLDSSIIRLGDKIKLPINNLTPKEVIYHTISDQEFDLFARLIHGEARGESYIGQVAVGAVILNRVVDSYFPDNITDVIYQPRQFSPVADGQINLRPNRTSYRAARAALRGEDPTRGAMYFYNPRTAKFQWWFKTRETVVQIGNHVFAK